MTAQPLPLSLWIFLKPSRAITVSALMDGYGRQLADFLKPTYMFQLDFDHVKKEDMVIEKEPIELNSDAAVDPTDTFED